MSQNGRAVTLSVPVVNSEIDATNLAAAANVSAVTAVSVTVVGKLTFAVTESDPVALSVTDALVINFAVTTSVPVADSWIAAKTRKPPFGLSVAVAVSLTFEAEICLLDTASEPVPASVTVVAYIGVESAEALPVAVSTTDDNATFPVRIESEPVALSLTLTLIPSVEVTASVAKAASPSPPQEL
jgi:hypothetical protein